MDSSGFVDLGFAKIDLDRKRRTGAAEVVFCENKADEHLAEICKRIYSDTGELFATRANPHQYEVVKALVPEAEYDEVSRIIRIEKKNKKHIGNIAVCSAGTADISVAEEAARTAEFLGARVNRFYDVGVSGIHRLMDRIEEIREANCVIAVAGMEGALTSVLGGMVQNPVIGVPTSVGYGVSADGHTALNAMLASCANGVVVVNIDNGYGAGYVASQINKLAAEASEQS